MAAAPTTMRLDRLLANLGYGSRREVASLVYRGQVLRDGLPLENPEERLSLTEDLAARMIIAGDPLDPIMGMALMLHKPLGVTCSHKEVGKLVYDLLPARWKLRDPKISTVGRLDKETSGLLLLTDDGALLHRIIAPKSHVAKIYHVTLDRPLRGDEAAQLAAGTLLLEGEEKPLLPVEMEALSPIHARVTLHEGRYHQVRRMFAALGNHVVALHREQIGGLALPSDLPAGAFRLLTPADRTAIFASDCIS